MKKMYFWLFSVVMVVLSISLAGCDSAVTTNKEVPNSEKQKTLHQLKQISFILLDIAQKPEMIQIIKQGVDLKFDGDENILLDDLINPSQTFLKQSEVQHFKKNI